MNYFIYFITTINMSCMIEKDTAIQMNTDYEASILIFHKRSTNNFLRYIDEHRYKSLHFYRTVVIYNKPKNNIEIKIIQGGLGFQEQLMGLPPILHKTTDII
ncbi:MAG: hypothetical protein ACJZ10_00915 [Candidatus Neomarinimicrobiota bacterium]